MERDHRGEAGSAGVVLDAVTKHFGGALAVDDLSLEVRAGEFLCVLGPSGCGKTTLLRMIAGLEEPSSGAIWIGGDDITDVPSYRRSTAMVFQTWALFPHRNIFQNVSFGLKMRGHKMRGESQDERRRRVSEYLELVQLAGFENRMPAEMSGGEQQRAALARALIVEPRVLLLDEPLSNLDLKLRQRMRFELREIFDRLRITTILVTHDQTEALEIADRVAVLNDGKLEQIGSPSDIYERPVSSFVAEFVGETNFFSGRVLASDRSQPRLLTPSGLSIALPETAVDYVDQPAIVAIRPEQIVISRPADQRPENSFRSVVTTRTYRGSTVCLGVTFGADDELVLEVDRSEASHSVGDEITVGWDPEVSVCLRS